jgi:hypothetical protein
VPLESQMQPIHEQCVKSKGEPVAGASYTISAGHVTVMKIIQQVEETKYIYRQDIKKLQRIFGRSYLLRQVKSNRQVK